MRCALVGAVETTVTALETLAELGCRPLTVVTLPESRSARHSDWVDIRPVAERKGVPLVETVDVNGSTILDALRQLDLDYTLVIGWSQICKPEFLSLSRRGTIGFHPSPLPVNRGRAVIPWTILQKRSDTGSTLFWIDEGMDTGNILAQKTFPVLPDETARSLYDKHLVALRQMLLESVPLLDTADPPMRIQDHAAATFCARRTAADGCIDWSEPAEDVWALVRAVGDPYPGAFSYTKTNRITIWSADFIGPAPYWGLPGQVQTLTPQGALVQCGDREHILLRTVQLDGREREPASGVLRVHERLSTHDMRTNP